MSPVRRMAAALRGRFRPTQPSKTVGWQPGAPLSAAQQAEVRAEAAKMAEFINEQIARLETQYKITVSPRGAGGPVKAGTTYLVGKRGREEFKP